MKENISIGVAVLAIVISIVAITSTVIVKPVATIGASSVSGNELADNSVTSGKVADGTLTDADINDTGISKIADNAITSDQIASSSITLEHLTSAVIEAITGVDIANNSITGVKIADGTIANVDISASADIDPSKINGTAWTATNDGSASGLDADTLDGVDSAQFVRNDIVETRYYTIPACGFVGRDHDTPYRYYGQGFSLRNMDPAYAEHDYYAPLNLPHGATITKMTVNYSIIDALASATVKIYVSPYTIVKSVSLPLASSFTNNETVLSETVDNNNQAYYIQVNLDPNDGSNDVALQWVCITYTVTNPLP